MDGVCHRCPVGLLLPGDRFVCVVFQSLRFDTFLSMVVGCVSAHNHCLVDGARECPVVRMALCL